MPSGGSFNAENIIDCVIPSAYCPKCGQNFDAVMSRNRVTGRILLIRIARTSVDLHTACPHCGLKYSFTSKTYKLIINSQNKTFNLNRELKAYLDRQRKLYIRYKKASEKKTYIAALLAFFLGIFGAQNWYMGHKGRGIISGLMDIFAVLMLLPIFSFSISGNLITALTVIASCLIAANVYWGLIDTIRILSGCAKDGDGFYIMTKRQFEKRNLRYMELN